jgi:hypothetical protein
MEFFIVANSFAAPFVSDQSTHYVKADSAADALDQFSRTYRHPAGLYAAICFASADDYHKDRPVLATWKSNHVIAMEEATKEKLGYSSLCHAPGDFEIDGKRVKVNDPKSGKVMLSADKAA